MSKRMCAILIVLIGAVEVLVLIATAAPRSVWGPAEKLVLPLFLLENAILLAILWRKLRMLGRKREYGERVATN